MKIELQNGNRLKTQRFRIAHHATMPESEGDARLLNKLDWVVLQGHHL